MSIASKSIVKQLIKTAPLDAWSYQGFGMLRLYLPDNCRLHIWVPDTAVKHVSTIHNHPWDFTSYIVVGHITNVRYLEVAEPFLTSDMVFREIAKIQCGVGGCQKSLSKQVRLIAGKEENYDEGMLYFQRADELHETFAVPGTVTIIERKPKTDTEHALVAWPVGETWVSAEPRPATESEHKEFTQAALGLF